MASQFQIKPHKQSHNIQQLTWLIWGESGAGKTRLACTFPNPLVLDMDKGMSSVDWEVDSVEINSWGQIGEVLYWLLTEEHNYQSVVFDSLNKMQSLSMRSVVENYPLRRAYDSQPSPGDWGKSLNDIDAALSYSKQLLMHKVWIAQLSPPQFDGDFVTPQMSGKNTVRNIVRMVDENGYIYVTPDGNAITFHSDMYLTKDRVYAFHEHAIENPTYPVLEELLKKAVE